MEYTLSCPAEYLNVSEGYFQMKCGVVSYQMWYSDSLVG
jgi:hypothetical protein